MSADAAFSLTAYFISSLIGFLSLKKFTSKDPLDPFLTLGLASGIGLAFTTMFLFIFLCIFKSLPQIPLVAAHILALAFFLFKKPSNFRIKAAWPKKESLLWVFLLFLTVCLFFAKALKSPYGSGMDVWEIWKLKAQLIYKNPSYWQNIFSRSLASSHPDYPLYYPLSICWGWILAGKENMAASLEVSLIFTLSTLSVLAGSLRDKGLKIAAIAGCLLLSTPHFMGMGSSQYADILIAYFCLSALVLFQLSLSKNDTRLACLSGFFAGSATFVKNEGLLLYFAIATVIMIVSFRRHFIYFLAASLPLLFCTAYFKYLASYPNEMLSLQSWNNILSERTVWDRAGVIGRSLLEEFTNENSWGWGWYFLGALTLLKFKRLVMPEILRLVAILLIINLGYFFIYLGTPLPLKMHLETSLNRLLLHTYPAIVYLGFLVYANESA